jgi:hypothetical protein
VLAEGFGSYLENISFDEKQAPIWTINDTHLNSKWNDPEDKSILLFSDCSKRPDLLFIREEKWEAAEKAKHELEEL